MLIASAAHIHSTSILATILPFAPLSSFLVIALGIYVLFLLVPRASGRIDVCLLLALSLTLNAALLAIFSG